VNRRSAKADPGSFTARTRGQPVILKVLHREACRDSRSLHRFLTVTRLIGRVSNASLPAPSRSDGSPSSATHYVAYEDIDGEPLFGPREARGPESTSKKRGRSCGGCSKGWPLFMNAASLTETSSSKM